MHTYAINKHTHTNIHTHTHTHTHPPPILSGFDSCGWLQESDNRDTVPECQEFNMLGTDTFTFQKFSTQKNLYISPHGSEIPWISKNLHTVDSSDSTSALAANLSFRPFLWRAAEVALESLQSHLWKEWKVSSLSLGEKLI